MNTLNKFTLFLSLLLLFMLVFIAPASSQQVQVPFDNEGNILEINPKMRAELGLFKEYTDFIKAHLYREFDDTYMLEIIFKFGPDVVRKQIRMTEEEVIQFRMDLSEKIKVERPISVLDQNGRTRLLVNSSALALGFYGWSVPASMEIHDGRTAVGMYLATTGLAFYLPYLFTEESTVTEGSAGMHVFGTRMGILHGVHLDHLVRGEDTDFREVLIVSTIASIAEGIMLHQYAIKNKFTGGESDFIAVSSNTGAYWSYALCHATGIWDHDENNRLIAAAALGGSFGGFVAGEKLVKRDDYSRGDVKILRTHQLIGALIPFTIAYNAADSDKYDRTYSIAALIGSAFATKMSLNYLEGRDFSVSQGWRIQLSPFAGACMGYGIHQIANRNSTDKSVITALSVGATLGWLLINSRESKNSRIESVNRDINSDVSWNMQFAPEGILTLMINKDNSRMQNYQAPLVRFSLQF